MQPKEYLCCWSVKMNRIFGLMAETGEECLEQRGTVELNTPQPVHLKNSRLLMCFPLMATIGLILSRFQTLFKQVSGPLKKRP